MTTKAIRDKVLALPVAEKLSLVQDLWQSIAEESGDIKLSKAERDLLDERVEAHRRDPSAAQPWSVVKRRAMAKIRKRPRK